MSETWIVGVGAARTALRRDDVNTTELAWEAVRAALADAGIELREVQGAITASQDFWEGRTISSMSVNEIAGGTLGSEAKVAADATVGLIYAAARVHDGDQRLNLVVAHAKESVADPQGVELGGFDPYFQRPLRPDGTVAAALEARRFYAESGLGPADAARVVAEARGRSGVLDPLEPADVLASPPTADPLRELDRAPYMDAACALVICDDATAQRLGRPAVRLVGGDARSGPFWTDRDLARAPAARQAVDGALAQAGWSLGELDHVELNVPYAHEHLMLLRELGLDTADGAGPEVNPSGGWLGGCAGTVAGLASTVAATRRLRGTDGRALVHGATGLCAQSHAAVLLEGRA